MEICYIALGSNLENPAYQLESALDSLSKLEHCTLVSTSSLYQSKALGPAPQADYINAVCRIDTHLSATALLNNLQGIENRQGRERLLHWGPRTLDLDLLLYGEHKIATTKLQVPHPRMLERNFVLIPLAEIAPDLVIPAGLALPKKVSIESLLARLDKNDLVRLNSASGD